MSRREALRILQIAEVTPTKIEVKKAYRKLIKAYHPDLQKNKKIFNRLFQQLLEAYTLLMDDNAHFEDDIDGEDERNKIKIMINNIKSFFRDAKLRIVYKFQDIFHFN